MFYTIKHTGEVASSNPMEKEHILLLIIFCFSFFVLKPIAGADTDCLPSSCGPNEPEVRFPFRISGRQPARCGFPGFNLSCDQQNRTIIRLPSSLSYIVNSISYFSQVRFQILTLKSSLNHVLIIIGKRFTGHLHRSGILPAKSNCRCRYSQHAIQLQYLLETELHFLQLLLTVTELRSNVLWLSIPLPEHRKLLCNRFYWFHAFKL